ncbi:MAG: hypothetical protein RLN83_06480 [Balneola sp.]
MNFCLFNKAKSFFVLALLTLCMPSLLESHPWGGLVIDQDGNIYFTFICPIDDDANHYACVWKITPNNEMIHVLRAQRSPSDIILSRNSNREIFSAERTGQNPHHNNTLWIIDQPKNQVLIPSTTAQNQFHIQSIAVNEEHEIYFSKDSDIFFRDSLNQITKINTPDFERINLTAWGPDEELYIMSGDDIYIYDGSDYKLLASDLKKRNPEDIPFSGANIFFDMVVDESKNVYLTYYGNREVIKISPDGIASTILKSEKPWSPHGIDIFNGEIYVLESTIGDGKWWKFWEEDPGIIPRVRKISADGTVSTIYNFKSN